MNRWLPVIGGVSLNLALGALYAWSVFVPPLEKEFHWTRADTSWVYTIAVIVFTASFVVGGRIQDRTGPKITAFLGGTLVAVGFILASFTSSLSFLFATFGAIVGLGNGLGYSTPIPVASKWFPDKRGLVVGLMVAGYGATSAILALPTGNGPLVNVLIDAYGWRATFRILGVLFFLMGMVGVALLKNPPAGYRPANWTPTAAVASRRDYSPAEMLQTPAFYKLWIAFALGTTAGQMVISQLVPFARSAGWSAAFATYALTAGAFGNVSGRILSGWMSDTFGRLATLRTMVIASALAMPILFLLRENSLLFYPLVAAVYWCYGTQLSLFPSTTADFYGTRDLGMNYGLLFTAWGAAGILGPFIAGRVFNTFNDYGYAFYAAAGLALLAFISLTLARTPETEQAPVARPARA